MQYSGLEEFLNSFPVYESSSLIESDRKWDDLSIGNPVEMFAGMKANSEE